MKNTRSGFSVVELMVVVGMMAVVSAGMLTLMNSLFKGISSAQKTANKTDTMKAISTAFSDTQLCKTALGTLTFPATWNSGAANAITIPSITIGADTVAAIDATINDVRVTDMKLEQMSGPFAVKYNVAAPSAAPDLRNYKRYFAKLTVTSQKSGKASDVTGGVNMKDAIFRLAILVDDTNKLSDCFGGMNESDLAALCEKALEGIYDPAKYPWCTVNRFAVGMSLADVVPTGTGRLVVKELQDPVNPGWDATMFLLGNVGGNGPGLHWISGEQVAGMTPSGTIGLSNGPLRYGMNPQKGDFSIAATGGDLHLMAQDPVSAKALLNPPTNLYIKNNGQVSVNTVTPSANAQMYIKANTNNTGLTVSNPLGQGVIHIAGASDGGATYSALYLGNSVDNDVKKNSWVMSHRGPAPPDGLNESFDIDRWLNGGMANAFTITAQLRVGIGTQFPSEKLQVAGNTVIDGTLKVAQATTLNSPLTVNAISTFNNSVTVNGTVMATSDRRLKKDIQPLENSLDKILRIDPVSYKWKDESLSQRRQLGFIAQDLEKVIPEVVETKKDGIKSVAYMNIIAVVVGAVQEIYHKLLELMTANENTSERVKTLEKKLDEVLKKQELLEQEVLSCKKSKGRE